MFELRNLAGWSYYHLPQLEVWGVIHGFMTKSSNSIVLDRSERRHFADAFGSSDTIIMEQEHSDQVHVVEHGERPAAGDGLILVEKGVMGVIKTADCLPVILFERNLPAVAVVHAGWRGTAQRITEKAVRRMIDLGGKIDAMGAAIGPGIGPCCYEVGEEVAREFRRAGFSDGVWAERKGKIVLDLKKANRELIEAQGVENIYDIGLCTSCRGDLFFSARRDGQAGRQANFVQLRGPSI